MQNISNDKIQYDVNSLCIQYLSKIRTKTFHADNKYLKATHFQELESHFSSRMSQIRDTRIRERVVHVTNL